MTSRFGGAVGGGQGSKFGGVQISEQENIQAEIDAAQESKPISALDQALGASPTIASGAVGGALGEIAGIARIPTDPNAARPLADNIAQSLTIDPNTEAGRQGLLKVANNPVVKAIGELDRALRSMLSEGGRSVAGDTGAAVGGFLPSVFEAAIGGRTVTSLPQAVDAVEDVTETLSTKAIDAVKSATQTVKDAAKDTLNNRPERKQALELIQSGQLGDTRAAQFRLDRKGKLETNPNFKTATQQGFNPEIVSIIRGGNEADRAKISAIVDSVERNLRDPVAGARVRPSDIAGQSIGERLDVVLAENRRAGQEIDEIAKSLEGKTVDVTSAVDEFLDDLDEAGIDFNPSTRTLNFDGSLFDELSAPQSAIKRAVNVMLKAKNTDAKTVHNLKKWIDENVTFGRSEGLGGQAESILKNLRRNLDQSLDTNFPDYNRANIRYAETRGIIDEFQDLAGKKVNLRNANSKAQIGILSRRILSNAQSRGRVLEAVDNVDRIAKELTGSNSSLPVPLKDAGKSSGRFQDDVIRQIVALDEIERVFKTSARTSLQGDLEKSVSKAQRFAQSPVSTTLEAGAGVVDDILGTTQTPENAIQVLRNLLSEQ